MGYWRILLIFGSSRSLVQKTVPVDDCQGGQLRAVVRLTLGFDCLPQCDPEKVHLAWSLVNTPLQKVPLASGYLTLRNTVCYP